MKKNLLWMLAAILLCGVMTISCSKDDEDVDIPTETTYLYYVQSVEVLYLSDDIPSSSIKDIIDSEYKAAISALTSADNKKEQDAAVIAACDKVFQAQKAKYGSNLSGKVTIAKETSVNGTPKETKSLKVYTY